MNKHTRSVSLIDGHTEDRTDAEIIEALEYKSKVGCELCNLKPDIYCQTCNIGLLKQSLDLIDRKNNTINALERLKDSQQAEIEMLQKKQQLIKSEAIKEFAEMLKQRYDKPLFYLGSYEQFLREVDNLVKEMTEVKKIENTESN